MQSVVVMAFRKRVKHHGYTRIQIRKIAPDTYRVSAVDPLGGNLITALYTETEMHHAFRRMRGGRLDWVKPSPADYEVVDFIFIDSHIKCYYVF